MLEQIIEKGDLILLKNDSILSRIIKFFSKSEYSHVAVYLEDGFVIESDWGGVQISHLRKYKSVEYDVYYHAKMDKDKAEMLTQWMLGQVGSRYDYGGIFGILLNKLGLTKKNHWDDKASYWCCELVADAYLNVGLKVCAREETWLVSPGDLANCKEFILLEE